MSNENLQAIERVVLTHVTGGANRVTPRATDPTLKSSVEQVANSVKDLAREQNNKPDSSQMMLPMMMMMMKRR